MTTEYTPSMATIKECFIDGAAGEFLPEDFDRALAAYAREVVVKTLREAAKTFDARLPDGTGNGRAYNSYTVARMLREIAAKQADRLEQSND